ncbi:unnamed protein product [Adineta ricciae]|uniref:Ribosomal RNA-processing protein 8 n=1 Tax=Adineta ricciae TaxID=249248 RepID=A0A815KTX1_ADIRI|nr:unnamed protein product [Adineta ricciae]
MEVLHILVFDEAHWGIAKESNSNRFFQRLSQQVTELVNNGKKPSLIILLVSATIKVLTRAMNEFQENERHRVNWRDLRLSQTATIRQRFAAPNYTGIMKLVVYNDVHSNLISKKNLVDRSSFVVEEYLSTLHYWKATVYDGNTQNDEWKTNGSWQLLKYLLTDDTNKEKIHGLFTAADYAPAGNHTALIRLQQIKDVTSLYEGIMKLFNEIRQIPGEADFRPFELIQLNNDCIWDELSDKARRHPSLQKVRNKCVIKHLHSLPCLILVVDKLGIGERLSSNCMAYDIRARYKGDPNNMDGQESTFVQDVGRCAGHSKPKALVLMAFSSTNNVDNPQMKDIIFPRVHGLMTKKNNLTIDHPENGAGVFSELKLFMIILEAEPQIGKTGAIMALLDILYSEHTKQSKSISPVSPPATTTSYNPSDLQTWTKKYCDILNKDYDINVNIEQLKNVFNSDNNFQRYHEMLKDLPEKTDLSENIFTSLEGVINGSSQKTPCKIIDCGCGLNGIFHTLLERLEDISHAIRVIGIDLHSDICKQVDFGNSTVMFQAIVGDMASNDEVVINNDPYDAVIYSLSLFENDISRHVEWTSQRLRTNGRLIIADVQRRFPADFEENVKKAGFRRHSKFQTKSFTIWVFTKKTEVSLQPSVCLNQY